MGYSGYKKKFVGTEYPGADNRGFVPEHRYVAEQKIGRQLRKGEVVHHCDRNQNLFIIRLPYDKSHMLYYDK